MNHYAPHPSAAFEGYYSKFALPSGSHLIIVICSVRRATSKPHMLSFTYTPPSDTSLPVFQRQLWVADIKMRSLPDQGNAFELSIPTIGHLICTQDETVSIDLKHEDFTFSSQTTSPHTYWTPTSSTPAGLLTYLPLPLQWHVHSRSTECTFNLSIPLSIYSHLDPADTRGNATVHLEKNWGQSFPSAHIWIQGYSSTKKRGICVAGGKILGMQAFLIGYIDSSASSTREDPNLREHYAATFTPPFSLSVLGISPFMTREIDYPSRTVRLDVSNFTQRLVVKASAPKDGWFELAAPKEDGHHPGDLAERFGARVEVEVFERGWLGVLGVGGGWRRVREEVYEGSAEFAGEYYGKEEDA